MAKELSGEFNKACVRSAILAMEEGINPRTGRGILTQEGAGNAFIALENPDISISPALSGAVTRGVGILESQKAITPKCADETKRWAASGGGMTKIKP